MKASFKNALLMCAADFWMHSKNTFLQCYLFLIFSKAISKILILNFKNPRYTHGIAFAKPAIDTDTPVRHGRRNALFQ
jgi:hypothetical protein